MAVKEAISFLSLFVGKLLEITAYPLPFSTSFGIIFGLKTKMEFNGKSNYSKLEFKFKTDQLISPQQRTFIYQ